MSGELLNSLAVAIKQSTKKLKHDFVKSLNCLRSKNKNDKYKDLVMSKMENHLDIRTIVKTQKTVKIILRHLFTPK